MLCWFSRILKRRRLSRGLSATAELVVDIHYTVNSSSTNVSYRECNGLNERPVMCSWSGDRTAIYSKSLDFTCSLQRKDDDKSSPTNLRYFLNEPKQRLLQHRCGDDKNCKFSYTTTETHSAAYVWTVLCLAVPTSRRNFADIGYDTRCYFNVRSKADMSRLNLLHGSAVSFPVHARTTFLI